MKLNFFKKESLKCLKCKIESDNLLEVYNFLHKYDMRLCKKCFTEQADIKIKYININISINKKLKENMINLLKEYNVNEDLYTYYFDAIENSIQIRDSIYYDRILELEGWSINNEKM